MLLGHFRGAFGGSWSALRALLGHSWGCLGVLWAPLDALGTLLGYFGRLWARPGVDFWSIWMRSGLGCFVFLLIFFRCACFSHVFAIAALSVPLLGQV